MDSKATAWSSAAGVICSSRLRGGWASSWARAVASHCLPISHTVSRELRKARSGEYFSKMSRKIGTHSGKSMAPMPRLNHAGVMTSWLAWQRPDVRTRRISNFDGSHGPAFLLATQRTGAGGALLAMHPWRRGAATPEKEEAQSCSWILEITLSNPAKLFSRPTTGDELSEEFLDPEYCGIDTASGP